MTDLELMQLLPLPAGTITCGLRTDLFKKQRRHIWVYMGLDHRNKFEKGYQDVHVWICERCGKDKDECVN